MFFFFSKTAGYLTQPMVIVCILFLSALLVRKPRRKKILTWIAFVAFFIFSNQFLALTFMGLWEISPIPFSEVKGPYDYGVLLTGVTKGEAGPNDRVYFGGSADRATHTLYLYKLGLVRKILIAGGSGKLDGSGVLEANELATFFMMVGVPKEDLVLENRSKNTHESAVEVARLLADSSQHRLLLVTSGYHLRRAQACFRKSGLNPDVFATEPYVFPGGFSWDAFIVPKAEAFHVWQILFKEWAGMIAYWMAGYI
jgi:uncharacterized SAM-binding protein YcdF (DUF218 family)